MNDCAAGRARVRVYSRRGCHLCEILIEELMPLLRGRADLEVCDVDLRPDWQSTFGQDVPVVEIDGKRVCQHALDRSALQAALDRRSAAQPGKG